MLIVMSDLHLAESKTNQLGDTTYNLNLPALVYQNYFLEIQGLIHQNNVKKIDLVLAGDIFEITRSGFWLLDNLRPYDHLKYITSDSPVEGRIIELLKEIEGNERVAETLQVFRSLKDIFQIPVEFHYIPGNHDRLINSTQKTRNKVRELLGMENSEQPFDNQIIYKSEGEPLALIRHGHEYDPKNFSTNLNYLSSIPTKLEKKFYDQPNIGDFITTDIGSRLPVAFKEFYGVRKILEANQLQRIYQRLIEFDNVRPATALLNFLFATPGIQMKKTWEVIEPVFNQITREIGHYRNHLIQMLKTQGQNSFSMELILRFLTLKPLMKNFPYWLIRGVLKGMSKKIKIKSVRHLLIKESFIKDKNNPIKCLIFGHTHVPEVEILAVKNGKEVYSINSGTWRMQIPASPDLLQFGRLRSLTKVLVFGSDEVNPEYGGTRNWSFDFNSEIGYGKEEEI